MILWLQLSTCTIIINKSPICWVGQSCGEETNEIKEANGISNTAISLGYWSNSRIWSYQCSSNIPGPHCIWAYKSALRCRCSALATPQRCDTMRGEICLCVWFIPLMEKLSLVNKRIFGRSSIFFPHTQINSFNLWRGFLTSIQLKIMNAIKSSITQAT